MFQIPKIAPTVYSRRFGSVSTGFGQSADRMIKDAVFSHAGRHNQPKIEATVPYGSIKASKAGSLQKGAALDANKIIANQ